MTDEHLKVEMYVQIFCVNTPCAGAAMDMPLSASCRPCICGMFLTEHVKRMSSSSHTQ